MMPAGLLTASTHSSSYKICEQTLDQDLPFVACPLSSASIDMVQSYCRFKLSIRNESHAYLATPCLHDVKVTPAMHDSNFQATCNCSAGSRQTIDGSWAEWIF